MLVLWIVRLETRIARLLRGKNAKSLEGTIQDLIRNSLMSDDLHRETKDELKNITEELEKTVQNIETIRFSAFGEGGNQSFATALLDKKGNGVVMSSLYARERVSVFSKPIKGFVPEYELSKEERQALEQAKSKLKQK